MYKARIITDAGREIGFGTDYYNVFSIDPLSGTDVEIFTSQGFQQIGNTIEGMGVGGLTRTISGVFYGNHRDEAFSMLQSLPIFTTGRLYIDDEYYCEIAVKKTPEIKRKGTFYQFAFQVYCRTPFWYSAQISEYEMGAWQKLFSFPASYDSHIYAQKDASAFVSCFNSGAYKTEPTIVFKSDSTVTGYGLLNAVTNEYIRINGTLLQGDIVTIGRRQGQIYVERERDGEVEDIFAELDEGSTLYWIEVGENILRMTADTHQSSLQCVVSYSPVYMGVLDAS